MTPQERIQLEREGARYAREFMEASSGFLGLLGPYVQPGAGLTEEAMDAIVALFSGYIGAYMAEMPDIPVANAVQSIIGTFAAGFPEEITARITVAVEARLGRSRLTTRPPPP